MDAYLLYTSLLELDLKKEQIFYETYDLSVEGINFRKH